MNLDPEVVWRVWRRIQLESALREAVLSGDPEGRYAAGFEDPMERAVFSDYASTPHQTGMHLDWAIFERGAKTVDSLSRVVPSSRFLLEKLPKARRDDLAAKYVRQCEPLDCEHGPEFCLTSVKFLDHLLTLEALTAPPGWRSVFELDRAALQLWRQLGPNWRGPAQSDEGFDPETVESYDDCAGWCFVGNDSAALVSVDWDLSPWLEDPRWLAETTVLDDIALAEEATTWLLFLPDSESDVLRAPIPPEVSRIWRVLDQPREVQEIGALAQLDENEVLTFLGELLELSVIRAVRAQKP